jgi:hypothetical protein
MSSRRSSAKKRHAPDSQSRKKTKCKKTKRKKSEKELAWTRAWRAIHQPEVNARRRHLWATDPEYRARKLAECHASIRRRKRRAERDPVYGAKLRDAKRTNNRRSFLKNKYGISLEEYDAMLARQGGRCATCKRRPVGRLCVDHCHVTGKVRGLLCRKCNIGIGHLDDDTEVLQSAADYLIRARLGDASLDAISWCDVRAAVRLRSSRRYSSNTATARIGEPVPPRHFSGRPMKRNSP